VNFRRIDIEGNFAFEPKVFNVHNFNISIKREERGNLGARTGGASSS